MSRPTWQTTRRPLPLLPIDSAPPAPSIGDQLCYGIAAIAGILVIVRALVQLLAGALS